MDLGLRDAAVAVNGGSKGMGRAAAETIAAEGAINTYMTGADINVDGGSDF
jgi:hypothetical protein